MKYKDRKDAKRKYKQALLTTVATMTLGVSTLGPAASAFAAEGDNTSVISSHTINHAETQMENNKPSESNWMNKVTAEINMKSFGKFTGTTMFELYKFANKGPEQLNDSLRAISIASTGFIPYGGMFVAPLIGVIWPETNGIKSQLNVLREDLTKMVTNEIDNEQLNFLNSEFKTLIDLQTDLEHAVNADNSQITDENTKNQRGAWANGIERSFRSLLNHTSSDKHKITNLPIYTKVALTHLMFLNALNNKAVSSKMNITEQSLKELYTKDGVKPLANDYVLHIMKTYYDATAQHVAKIKLVPEFLFNLHDAENQIKDLKDRLSKVEAEYRQWGLGWSSGGGIAPIGGKEDTKFKSDIAILQDAISSYEFVDKLYTTTVGDPMIKEQAKENKTYLFKDNGELIVADATYQIVYSKANKIVDFGYDGIDHPVIWYDHSGKNQRWEFKYDADKKAYQIINSADGRVLAYDTRNVEATALVTENQHKPEHYWILEDAGAGNVLLVNYENKNKVLDVYD
ncbi:TPA: RICIN domain-containing protein [Bacillus cereus]|nr:RICIN domain-containing protein [Bacillus cereus]